MFEGLFERLKRHDEREYRNELLRFSIVKPDEWTFREQRWSSQFDPDLYKHSEFRDILVKKLVPFVEFYCYHRIKRVPYPTVRCGCRVDKLTVDDFQDKKQSERLAAEITSGLGSYRNLKIDRRFKIGENPALAVEFAFTVNQTKKKTVECFNRTILLKQGEFTIIISLSGSADPQYGHRAELNRILDSVRIDKMED